MGSLRRCPRSSQTLVEFSIILLDFRLLFWVVKNAFKFRFKPVGGEFMLYEFGYRLAIQDEIDQGDILDFYQAFGNGIRNYRALVADYLRQTVDARLESCSATRYETNFCMTQNFGGLATEQGCCRRPNDLGVK